MRMLMWFALFAFGLNSPVALAQSPGSAKAMLPHCIAELTPDSNDPIGARCMGIIGTLSFVSRVLPDEFKFCHPAATTPKQILQAISSFMDANLEMLDQDFRLIALAAMRDKWPCQE